MQLALPSRYLHIKGFLAVCFPHELCYETLFLKILNSPVTEHREVKLNWAETFFHTGYASVLEGAIHAAEGESSPIVLLAVGPVCKTSSQTRCVPQYNNGKFVTERIN